MISSTVYFLLPPQPNSADTVKTADIIITALNNLRHIIASGQRFTALRAELRRLCLILRGVAAGRTAYRLRRRSRASAVLAEFFRLTLRSAGRADPHLIDGCLSRAIRNRRRLQSSAVVAESGCFIFYFCTASSAIHTFPLLPLD